MITFTAGPSEAGSRLDRLLRKRMPLMSLPQIYGLIRRGDVRVNGKKVKQSHRLAEGEHLEIKVEESEFQTEHKTDVSILKLTKTDFFRKNFNILFEDDSILVCNKPAGLVVHSGSGHLSGDNLVDLATAYVLSKKNQTQEQHIPVLMHRLDRDTSGVILLAKHKGVVRQLHDLMRKGDFTKQYLAVSHNRPPEFEDTITLNIKRTDRSSRGMKMTVEETGRESRSTYRLLEYQNNLSMVEVFLHTGKTHQIRVHMAHLKSPILGDQRYGSKELDQKTFSTHSLPKRLYLHAQKLTFPHPFTKKMTTITAPVPKEFRKVFETL
ncbi:MAG: RluA family pseudouridine synthase [Chitinispirillaceae bacterium]